MRELANRRQMLKRFKQAWKRDLLGVLGVGAAVVAFLFWSLPYDYCAVAGSGICTMNQEWFTSERLPAIAAFLALAFVLLLLRRR